MKSILLVAHGSRRQSSNNEVHALTAKLREKRNRDNEIFECAFLELAEPCIPDGIQLCIDKGATEVLIVPYFLSAGRHVAEDIPNEVKQKQNEHPAIKITISEYLGNSERLQDALLDLIDHS